MSIVNTFKKLAKRLTGEVPTDELIRRGMRVGKDFNRQQGCFIDPTHCFLIDIGDNVTFSIRVTLMAHDASTKKSLGYTKIGRISVGDNVFVGANTTILPNVSIGNNVVIGANSLVTKSIPDNCVVAGNPAKVLCSLEEFKEKNTKRMNHSKVFGADYRFSKNMSDERKEQLIEATKDGIAFID